MDKLIYTNRNKYDTEVEKIMEEEIDGKRHYAVILKETIFYPQGGGQPSDLGLIKKGSVQFKIEKVTYNYDTRKIEHLGFFKQGSFEEGDEVKLVRDEKRRKLNARCHSAGHIIDLVIAKDTERSTVAEDKLIPVKAYHYPQGAYVQYKIVDPDYEMDQNDLEKSVNVIVESGLEVETKFVEKNELAEICDFVPDNLPENKPIRIVQYGVNKATPCGGTHVSNTQEVGFIKIRDIKEKGDKLKIKYSVLDEEPINKKEASVAESSNSTKNKSDVEVDEQVMLEKDDLELKSMIKVYEEFQKDSSKDVKELKKEYLGSSGKITKLLHAIGDQPKDIRPQFGKEANLLKNYITQRVENQIESAQTSCRLQQDLDLTAPFQINTELEKRPNLNSNPGKEYILFTELNKMIKIFQQLGFDVIDSRILDDDYHAFTSLNIPEGHPARDMWDTFWTEEGLIPTTQTSSMQNRIYKSQEPPIRMIIPGLVYRNEATDSRHEHSLAQVEGVYIDKDISISHMISIIKEFVKAYFEIEPEVKLGPAYFPFVEPGMEFAFACPFCRKTGCKTCGHKGWIEIFPCGMVHPNVLREGGIDPNEYSGFAWGFGWERIVMLKQSIDEIRNFRGGEIDFLKQF